MFLRRVSLLCVVLLAFLPGCLLDRSSLGPDPDASAPLDAASPPDAGVEDAASPSDAGPPLADAGPTVEDSGPVDAGPTPDAGSPDAGMPDAGPGLDLPGAPGAPTFSEVGTSSIRVSWSPPVTGGPVVSYELERAPESDPGAFVTVGTPSETTLVDGSLGVDSGYWYRVRAVNGAGPGPYSDAAPQKTGAALPVLRRQHDFAWATDPTARFPMVPAEGNLLVAIGMHRLNNASATITGWDQRINQQYRTSDGNRRQLVVFTRIAGSAEPQDVFLNWNGNRESRLLIQEFDLRGGTVDSIAEASSDNESTTTNSLVSSAAVGAGPCLVVGALGARWETGTMDFIGLDGRLQDSDFISIGSAFGELSHPGGTLSLEVAWGTARLASSGFVVFRRGL